MAADLTEPRLPVPHPSPGGGTPRSDGDHAPGSALTAGVPDGPSVPPVRRTLPAQPPVSVVATSDPTALEEQVVCPECGTTARVTLNARDARDFCRQCDYPLFWVPSRILLGRGASGDDSLRRLPGTVGRATIASLECPHCEEPNVVTAVYCLRCAGLLRPVPPEPLPAPPPVREEQPAAEEPEPEDGWPWWVWLVILLAASVALVIVVVVAGR